MTIKPISGLLISLLGVAGYYIVNQPGVVPTSSKPEMPSAATVAPAWTQTGGEVSRPAPAQPAANIRQSTPADWVRGLPSQAQSKYHEIRTSLRGADRIEAIRAWMALWSGYLSDPPRTLVEFDFIDFNLKNRSAMLYDCFGIPSRLESDDTRIRPPVYSELGTWKLHYQQRLTTLDSMQHMLRAIRVRGIRHAALAEMAGQFEERLANEREKLTLNKQYYEDNQTKRSVRF